MKVLVYKDTSKGHNRCMDVVADNETFNVSDELEWVDCSDDCEAGRWKIINKIPTAPIEPPEPTYADFRATDYPAIADQLDDIFHNGIKGWKATIQLTKDKYPKGGN